MTMARVLQVQDSGVEPVSATEAAEFPMRGTVAVFDPAMCCETGLCGPGVDPELLRIARDLRWLSAQGVTVHRAGLSQEPQAFVASTKVQGLLQAFGDGALPAVLVDGTVLTYGRYPTRDELVAVLTPTSAIDAVTETGGSCCAPGSGCC
jgi:Arsenical resistance operon protein ArsD